MLSFIQELGVPKVRFLPLHSQGRARSSWSALDATVDQYVDWYNHVYYEWETDAPTMEVSDFRSVIVPANLDGWPPEPGGDILEGWQCPQYAVEVFLGGSVRTVDGWARLFSRRHLSRHIIIRRT